MPSISEWIYSRFQFPRGSGGSSPLIRTNNLRGFGPGALLRSVISLALVSQEDAPRNVSSFFNAFPNAADVISSATSRLRTMPVILQTSRARCSLCQSRGGWQHRPDTRR
jgi:hypothetical protein